MEISKTECKRILRTLELKAYRSVVDALRAQGTSTVNKQEVLKSLAATLKISDERYRSEMRRAANDDLLSTIAQSTCGKNTDEEWRAESMKKVPITPMIASHTAFTVLADAISDIVSLENEKFSDSSESSNIIESYKSRNDENLKKYQSSKILDSLLKKRKDHHENLIFSELENIKLNNNYHPSPIKSGYIEISYDENSKTVDTQDQDFSFDDTNSPFDTTTFSSSEKSSASKKNFCENAENADASNSSARRINSKSRSKVRRSEKKNLEKKISPSNTSKISNTSRKRNLRIKPFKKYSWNSVEIRSFVEDTAKSLTPEDIDDNPVNETRRNVEKNETSESSKESHLEISYTNNNNNKLLKSRKSKQRNRNRTKFVRQSKMNRGRKKLKPDSVKEIPSRTGRSSSRNARRRNYARIASGDYDLLEFEKIRKEKNKEVEQIQDDIDEEDEDEINETDDDSLSDSSAAPIEISYSNPAAPKISDYDLDGVSSTYTETDDDMKPHTFNLIPASRRLKMLKKRAASPIGEEIPAKQIALVSQSNNEQSVTPTAKAPLLDINALKKVLAAQESSGNVTSSSLSDASDITDTKEISDGSDRLHPEPKENKPPFLVPPRFASEKKLKPKMRLSEASTIENLHSLLSLVKEGDLKKPSHDSNNKNKSCKKKRERRSSPRPTSPIVNNCNGSLIEVGSDTGSVSDNNYETVRRNSDSNDSIPLENDERTDGNVKPNNEVENSDRLVENDTQINEIVKPINEEIRVDSKNSPGNDIQVEEKGERKDESKQSESVSVNEDEVVSMSLEDLEDPVECHVSEQLIDIESADIIIGDSGEQNEELILTDTASTAVSEMNNQLESTIGETVKSVISPTVTIPNDKTEKKPNIVIVTSFQKNTEPLATTMNKQNTVLKSRQPNIKKLLAESADFVYKADADDPSLKQTLLKPAHLVTTTPSSGIRTIINSSKKFAKSSIKSANSIISNDSKTTNSSPNVLENKINQQNATTSSTFSKDRKFVLLDTKSITGSKSLLKPIKIIPKITIPSKTSTETISIPSKTMTEVNHIPKITIPNIKKTEANCIIRKSSTMGIYSSLENLNKFASSTGLNTIKTIVVSKKSTSEMDPKRLVLSQALERSLKSMETVKNQFSSSGETESTSNDSQKDNINSNLDEIITLFSNDDTSSNGDSESISSAEGLNEMKTFFSKNIIRKQS